MATITPILEIMNNDEFKQIGIFLTVELVTPRKTEVLWYDK